MVSDLRSKRRIVIVGAGSGLGRRLCQAYADDAHDIVAVDLAGSLADAAAACGTAPIDMLIFADDLDLNAPISTAERLEMRDALYRLTYAPFKLASLLRSTLAAAKGSVVLYSRAAAVMARQPDGGRPMDRPFRAAAHALWKCLEIEWREDGIRLQIVALGEPGDAADIVTDVHGSTGTAALLVEGRGLPLPW